MTKFPASPPESVEDLWYALMPVIDSLLHRVLELEKRLAAAKPMLQIVPADPEPVYDGVVNAYKGWVPRPSGTEHFRTDVPPHQRFVPDYDSEGAY